MISWPVAWSRLPVGSSASTIAGLPASALAMATRCCSPPDSWRGRWDSRWPRPTRSSMAAAALSPAPCRGDRLVEQGGRHVVQRGQRVEQEELLEDHADPPGAQAGERRGRTARTGPGPRSRPCPRSAARGRRPGAAGCVLPDPDGPTMAAISPGMTSQGHARAPTRPAARPDRSCVTSRRLSAGRRCRVIAAPALIPAPPCTGRPAVSPCPETATRPVASSNRPVVTGISLVGQVVDLDRVAAARRGEQRGHRDGEDVPVEPLLVIATWTGAWSRPAGTAGPAIVIVTGMAAGEVPAPPLARPARGAARARPAGRRSARHGGDLPDRGDGAGDGRGPVGQRDEHPVARRGRTGPPTVQPDRHRRGVSDVPDSTLVPVVTGVPAAAGVVVTRSGPGRNATVAERDGAGHGLAPRHCQRSTAASRLPAERPVGRPGIEAERGQVPLQLRARPGPGSCRARSPARREPARRAASPAGRRPGTAAGRGARTSPGAGSQVMIPPASSLPTVIDARVAERARDDLAGGHVGARPRPRLPPARIRRWRRPPGAFARQRCRATATARRRGYRHGRRRRRPRWCDGTPACYEDGVDIDARRSGSTAGTRGPRAARRATSG